MDYVNYKNGIKIGKQLYLPENTDDNEVMVSYHIIDIKSNCLYLLRDSVLEEKLKYANSITEDYPNYNGCVIDEFLSGEFLDRFDSNVKSFFIAQPVGVIDLKTQKYTEISRKCYIPSSFDFDSSAYKKSIGNPYWTATPSSLKTAVIVTDTGNESNRTVTKECGVRPIVCISRKYFEGNYVEDDNDGLGVSFDIMYSINIVDSKNINDTNIDTSKYNSIGYLNGGIEPKPVEISISRFTPKELRGFAKTNRNLMYGKFVLTVDYESCIGSTFNAFYIDNTKALIYGITVDEDRVICKYVYRYMNSDIVINSNGGSQSTYTPEMLFKFVNSNMHLKYFNSDLQFLDYINGSISFLEFNAEDSKIYKITVSSNSNITREIYKNLINTCEICYAVGSDYESRYDTEYLFNASNDNYTQITYNGNVLYVDKTATTLTEFNGYYFDEYDTAIYKVTVAQVGNYYKISRNLHKRIIKTVEIDGSVIGITSYTIQGIIDRSDYHISNIQDLYIEYPSGHFDVWVTATAGSNSACKVHFPDGTVFVRNQEFGYIGSTDTQKHIDAEKTREISIKDGVVVSMPHGEEWLEFDE